MNRLRTLAGRPLVRALACFVLIAAVVAGPALVGRVSLAPDTILDHDLLYTTTAPAPLPQVDDFTPTVIELPRDTAFAHGLAAGRLDQWNPLVACGAPLWAEQGGPFFPLKLPFYLAPSRRTYDAFLALRLVVAALGAYLLARRRGLAPVAATAAGATFEASGALAAHLAFGSASATFMLPWVLLGCESIARKPTPRAAAGAAVALAVTASGGHPMLGLLVFIAFVVALGGHIAASWRSPKTMLVMAAYGALAVAVGLALAAPAWMPLVELARLGSSYKDKPIGEIAWTMMLSRSRMMLPVALFAPALLELVRSATPSVHIFAPVVGTLGLVLAVTGVLRRRLDAGLATIGVFGIVLATVPPGFGWLHTLPGLRLVLPTYAWPLVTLALTQAAGAGVDALDSATGRRLAFRSVFLVCAALVSLTLVTDAGVFQQYGTALRSVLRQPAGIVHLVLPPLLTLLVFGGCVVVGRSRIAGWCGIAVAALAVVEELIIVTPLARQQPSAVLASPPSAAVAALRGYIREDWGRFLGVPYTVGHPLTPMLFDLPDVRNVSALPFRRLQLYREVIMPSPRDFTIQDVTVTRSPLLDVAAVRYVIVPRAGPPPLTLDGDEDTALLHRDRYVAIYKNRGALPRVRTVHYAVRVEDELAAQTWLRQFSGVASHASIVGLIDWISVEPDADGGEPPRPSGVRATNDSVRITDETAPDRLVLAARLETPGFVVVADTYDPGWTAAVDGTPTPVFPANLLFRAVFVPAGEHVVELRYRPPGFSRGLLVCVIGCLGFVALVRDKTGARWARALATVPRIAAWTAPEIVWLAALFAGTVAYLAIAPHDILPSDEGLFVYEAKRILDGATFYRDFFEIVTPLAWYLLAALFWLFGATMETTRGAVAVLGGGIVVLVYVACRMLGVRRLLATAAAVAHPAICHASFPWASPHWVSTALVLLMLLVVLRSPTTVGWRPLLLGILVGIVIGVQQQKGVAMLLGGAAVLTTDLWFRYRRPVVVFALFAAGVALVVGPLLLAIIATAGFQPAFDALVAFPLWQYAPAHRHVSTWGFHVPAFTSARPGLMKVAPVFFKYYVPLVLALGIVRIAVSAIQRAEPAGLRRLVMPVIWAASTVLSIWYVPNATHIGIVGPMLMVVVAENAEWLFRIAGPRFSRVGGTLLAGILLAALAMQLSWNLDVRRGRASISHETAFGRVDFSSPDEARLVGTLLKRLKREVPSREIFAYPSFAALYVMTGAVNATRYQILTVGYNSEAQIQEALDTLERKRVAYVAVMPFSFLSWNSDPVVRYLNERYERVDLGTPKNRLSPYILFQRITP